MDNPVEFEDFLRKVDDVDKIISGLVDGSIPPESVDVDSFVKKKTSKTASPKSSEGYTEEKIAENAEKMEEAQRSRPDPFFDAIQRDAEERAAKRRENHAQADALKVEGNALFSAGDYEAASKCYKKGLEIAKDHISCRLNLCQTDIRLLNFEEGLNDADEALRLADFLLEGKTCKHRHLLDARAKALFRRALCLYYLSEMEMASDCLASIDRKLFTSNPSMLAQIDSLKESVSAAIDRQRSEETFLESAREDENLCSVLSQWGEWMHDGVDVDWKNVFHSLKLPKQKVAILARISGVSDFLFKTDPFGSAYVDEMLGSGDDGISKAAYRSHAVEFYWDSAFDFMKESTQEANSKVSSSLRGLSSLLSHSEVARLRFMRMSEQKKVSVMHLLQSDGYDRHEDSILRFVENIIQNASFRTPIPSSPNYFIKEWKPIVALLIKGMDSSKSKSTDRRVMMSLIVRIITLACTIDADGKEIGLSIVPKVCWLLSKSIDEDVLTLVVNLITFSRTLVVDQILSCEYSVSIISKKAFEPLPFDCTPPTESIRAAQLLSKGVPDARMAKEISNVGSSKSLASAWAMCVTCMLEDRKFEQRGDDDVDRLWEYCDALVRIGAALRQEKDWMDGWRGYVDLICTFPSVALHLQSSRRSDQQFEWIGGNISLLLMELIENEEDGEAGMFSSILSLSPPSFTRISNHQIFNVHLHLVDFIFNIRYFCDLFVFF
eukprot:TRINITY_DN1527_c0_g1_i2.p1 TRINITY_DN1527_c0_g1~~TRINITY_DN1527_c0_g1_i2.p1  ORF type:complete len:721 (-),score=203.09 TRINITY_DN1527_c0_g1_i2:188-2350(-)